MRHTLCVETELGLSFANSSKFVLDKDGRVILQYTNGEVGSVVQLKCEKGRDKPFFKLEGISKSKNAMSVCLQCVCMCT